VIRPASPQEILDWDSLVLKNSDGGHIYNSLAWGEFKKTAGWLPNYFVYQSAGYVLYFCLSSKQASFLGNIYYCSKGPGFFKDFLASADSSAHFMEFCNELGPFMARFDSRAILVKIEPELLDGQLDMKKVGLTKAKADLQFKATIFVDLEPSQEDIIASFKQKTRYNIRLAERKGVVVEHREMTAQNVDLMYDLMLATKDRAGFFLRQKDYFGGYWQALAKAGLGQLLIASHEGEVLAGIYATHFGSKGYYKDGGSFGTKRNLMAPYFLQWQAMLWAKQQGVTRYDLVAVPPKSQLDDPSHPQAGLYQFKRGFNEEVTEFTGCWDLAISKTKYQTWLKTERQFLKLYSKMKSNLFW